MSEPTIWDLIFKPLTTALNELRDELHETNEKLSQISSTLEEISRATPPLPAVRLVFSASIDGGEVKENIMSLLLTDVQKATLKIAPVGAKGNPAPVDGVPAWSVADPTILTITPAADGLSADVASVGPLGASQVNVSADADLGAGVTTIAGTLDVTVAASQAVSLNISAGTPVNQ